MLRKELIDEIEIIDKEINNGDYIDSIKNISIIIDSIVNEEEFIYIKNFIMRKIDNFLKNSNENALILIIRYLSNYSFGEKSEYRSIIDLDYINYVFNNTLSESNCFWPLLSLIERDWGSLSDYTKSVLTEKILNFVLKTKNAINIIIIIDIILKYLDQNIVKNIIYNYINILTENNTKQIEMNQFVFEFLNKVNKNVELCKLYKNEIQIFKKILMSNEK